MHNSFSKGLFTLLGRCVEVVGSGFCSPVLFQAIKWEPPGFQNYYSPHEHPISVHSMKKFILKLNFQSLQWYLPQSPQNAPNGPTAFWIVCRLDFSSILNYFEKVTHHILYKLHHPCLGLLNFWFLRERHEDEINQNFLPQSPQKSPNSVETTEAKVQNIRLSFFGNIIFNRLPQVDLVLGTTVVWDDPSFDWADEHMLSAQSVAIKATIFCIFDSLQFHDLVFLI